MTDPLAVVAYGDAGVFVELGGEPGPATTRRVITVAQRVAAATSTEPGWGRPVPAATSVLVPVDPVAPGAGAAVERVRAILSAMRAAADDTDVSVDPDSGGPLEIPVRYGGPDGPDLEAVAARTGLTPAEVIGIHGSATYTALFLGFAPGFAYLGPLDAALVLARREEPRQHVPAGSVAIAGPQTAVYPVGSPGGWWIIGRTDFRVWDPTREPAAAIRAGARIRFVPMRS